MAPFIFLTTAVRNKLIIIFGTHDPEEIYNLFTSPVRCGHCTLRSST